MSTKSQQLSSGSRTEVLESLIVSTNRLTRLAAARTGNTVSSAIWSALSVLDRQGPHRTVDLARQAQVSQPGMTKVIQNLVADEWVLRIADVEDSRAWLIAITPKGRNALSSWRRRLAKSMSDTFSELDSADWDALDRASAILASRTERLSEQNEAVA